jgi:transposase
MRGNKYIVTLTSQDRIKLEKLESSGNTPIKKNKTARILLQADSLGGKPHADAVIAQSVGVSEKTVKRVRKKYVMGGLEKVFEKKFTPRLSRRKFKGEEEAQLIALCCSEAPEGYARWSLRLLANRVVELGIVETVHYRTIQETLKKTNLNLG